MSVRTCACPTYVGKEEEQWPCFAAGLGVRELTCPPPISCAVQPAPSAPTHTLGGVDCTDLCSQEVAKDPRIVEVARALAATALLQVRAPVLLPQLGSRVNPHVHTCTSPRVAQRRWSWERGARGVGRGAGGLSPWGEVARALAATALLQVRAACQLHAATLIPRSSSLEHTSRAWGHPFQPPAGPRTAAPRPPRSPAMLPTAAGRQPPPAGGGRGAPPCGRLGKTPSSGRWQGRWGPGSVRLAGGVPSCAGVAAARDVTRLEGPTASGGVSWEGGAGGSGRCPGRNGEGIVTETAAQM